MIHGSFTIMCIIKLKRHQHCFNGNQFTLNLGTMKGNYVIPVLNNFHHIDGTSSVLLTAHPNINHTFALNLSIFSADEMILATALYLHNLKHSSHTRSVHSENSGVSSVNEIR
mmetsp:Transcript_40569/g.95259  ORF Transcript_40569/g.95259 Transcript_40569/m.95259 type:complete len:113 (-) Transcript_40569:3758-4096(-)